MRIIRADLHIHTCLSPCGELGMSPRRIVETAIRKKIDLIAICDHNSAENVSAVIEVSRETNLTVIPGIEIMSKEEVHIIGLFDSPKDVTAVQELVYSQLEGKNDERVFGEQVVVDAEGNILDFNQKLLIGATNLSTDNIVKAIHNQNGLAIAAHIDREGFGIIGQLGFIPPGLDLDALEVSSKVKMNDVRTTFLEYGEFPFLQSSDAHRLDDIGNGSTSLSMESASLDELKMALNEEQGRRICYET